MALPQTPWRPVPVTDQLTGTRIYSLIDHATPRDGDTVVVEDCDGQRWRCLYRESHPLPFGLRIVAVSRAVIIPE